MLARIKNHVGNNVVGYLALFVALTGTAYAAAPLKPGDPAGGDLSGTYPNPAIAESAVTGGAGGKVADGTLTGADILESSLGKVPDADTLDGKDSADFLAAGAAAGGDLAGNFPNPTLRPSEAWHEVGAPGEPVFHACVAFGPNWRNFDANANSTAAFYRDQLGIVHLKGTVTCPGGYNGQGPIFVLPAGYRPEKVENHASSTASGYTNIAIFGTQNGLLSGTVKPTLTAGADTWLSLDGISFRCGPSGSNGCP